MREKVVVPFSNGIESTCLMLYYADYDMDVWPIVFRSDRTEFVNRESAIRTTLMHLGLIQRTHFLDLPDTDLLERQNGDIPGYKMMMVVAALSYAQAIGAQVVALGHNVENQAQPWTDQKESFLGQVCALYNHAYTKGSIALRIEQPFLAKTKAEVVKQYNHRLPFQHTVSCDGIYLHGRDHCGACHGCMDRKEAFARAGVLDSTHYRC